MTTLPDPTTLPPSMPPPGTARKLRGYLGPLAIVLVVTVFLWLVSLNNFALYHTTVEFTTIAISVAIFLLVWKSRKIIDNNYLLFVGITFIFIAILDFLHTLVYQGVGIFPDGGGALSTRFWIAARYMQAITLLAAPLFIRRKLRLDLIAIVYLAADIIIVSSIFVFRVFPATYLEGTGLTPFKIVSEYVIALLLIASVVLLYRNRESFDRQVWSNLAFAIFLMIAAELTFTEYASFVDFFSLLGHVFRLLAYYFFYRAIIEVGQEKPYDLLYHNVTESGKKYRALSELSPDGIVVLRDGVIQYANGAALRLSGSSSMEHLIGKTFTGFVHPDDRALAIDQVRAMQEDHIVAPLQELRLVAGGKTIPVEATGGPIQWEDKDAVQIVIRDITERKRATDEILTKNRLLNTANENLNALNEELTDTQEELHQRVDELNRREAELRQNETELKQALAEKEVLLSEIHHRVKNNLTAFISLLSLEGTYEDSEEGRNLKKDLQNRARSMALIHETLYRTKKFSSVDMDVYLATLTGQIAASYQSEGQVRILAEAPGVVLDLPRATPCGLIINELVTNSYKYAFPSSFDCTAVRGEPCTIRVAMSLSDGEYLLSVSDNGRGFPADADPLKAKSLGLKLVNFLARHQLRATVTIRSEHGTEFQIRFAENGSGSVPASRA